MKRGSASSGDHLLMQVQHKHWKRASAALKTALCKVQSMLHAVQLVDLMRIGADSGLQKANNMLSAEIEANSGEAPP